MADVDRIRNVAQRLVERKRAGHDVVAVVSARGDKTDELLTLAAQITADPPKRELDMLLTTGEQEAVALVSMAVHSLGQPAVSLIAPQIGMVTDRAHTKAKLLSISTERIRAELEKGNIVIVAGFQGVDTELNLTTLGRGGSNLTAVALAAALDAEVCENYTDVNGIYTCDPNVVPDARKLQAISYDEMLELTSLGASVLQSRSVEFAKKYNVPIEVRSSFSDEPGTMVIGNVPGMENVYARGVALNRKEAKVTILDVPDRPGIAAHILNGIVSQNISVDMIIQNASHAGHTDLTFTVMKTDLKEALATVNALAGQVGASDVIYDDKVAKLSVVGLGMRNHSGVAHRMFRALADRGINIQTISTSEIKISCLIADEQAVEAARAVHHAFQLHRATPVEDRDIRKVPTPPRTEGQSDLTELLDAEVQRLKGMEDIVVLTAEAIRQEAKVTLTAVPDRPGVAAEILAPLAEQGVGLNVILQNVSRQGVTDVTMTVLREDLQRAVGAAREACKRVGGRNVVADSSIATLSIVGIGMRSHTGIGARMFAALAEAGVNIQMISTSEIKIACIIEEAQAGRALAAVKKAFSLR